MFERNYNPNAQEITELRSILRKRFPTLSSTGRRNLALRLLNQNPNSYTTLLNMASFVMLLPDMEAFQALSKPENRKTANDNIVYLDDDESNYVVLALPNDILDCRQSA